MQGTKLTLAGKTAEAKTDLARLQEVRRRREAAAAQRQAEADGQFPVSGRFYLDIC